MRGRERERERESERERERERARESMSLFLFSLQHANHCATPLYLQLEEDEVFRVKGKADVQERHKLRHRDSNPARRVSEPARL